MHVCSANAAVRHFDLDVGLCERLRLKGCEGEGVGCVMGDPALESVVRRCGHDYLRLSPLAWSSLGPVGFCEECAVGNIVK